MNDKVDQLVLVHLLCVEVGDEEADVVALNWFPPQDEEILRSHHHKAHEFMAQNLFNLICLLDSDADADRVDGALDQNLLPVIAADDHRLEQQLLATPYFHLGLVVALHYLGGEVLQAERGLQGGTHSVEVRTQGRRHVWTRRGRLEAEVERPSRSAETGSKRRAAVEATERSARGHEGKPTSSGEDVRVDLAPWIIAFNEWTS